MFKLIKVEHQIWNHETYANNPSVDNHFTLYKFKDEQEFAEVLWELQCNEAESYADYDENEEEFADFVEDNSDYIVVDYDPTNPVHALHRGYEDERPEHAIAVKKELTATITADLDREEKRLIQEQESVERALKNITTAHRKIAYKGRVGETKQ